MPTKYRVALLLVVTIAALFLAVGCGGGCPSQTGGSTGGNTGGPASGVGNSSCPAGPGPGPGPSGNISYVYYMSAASLEAAAFNTSGTFGQLIPFTAPTLPSSSLNSMAIVNNKFLYIPVNGFSNVQAFSISQTTGTLTTIMGSPFQAQAADDSVTSDPAGRFLFVGGRFSPAVSVFQINPSTGALTPAPGSPFQSFNLVFSNSLAVDSTGKFLYVGQTSGSNPIAAFAIDQTTGALTEIPTSPFHFGVSVLAATPSGSFLLGIADDTGVSGDNHISVFSINTTTGTLAPVSGSPFTTVKVPWALSIHPNGKLVYASTVDSSQNVSAMEGYQLNTSGTLTAIQGSPFATIPVVAGCQFVQNGADAICMNTTGFSVLGVNTTTGALSHTVPDLVSAGNFPFAATN